MTQVQNSTSTADLNHHLTIRDLDNLCHERWLKLCQQFCAELGFSVEPYSDSMPAGIHFALKLSDDAPPVAYVSCARDRNRTVSMEEVTQLVEAMKSKRIPNGILFSAGAFLNKVWEMTDEHPVDLINYKEFVHKTELLTKEARSRLKRIACSYRFLYPICPICSHPMSLRDDKFGKYWRCDNENLCHMTYTC